jgi:hypothetical protein
VGVVLWVGDRSCLIDSTGTRNVVEQLELVNGQIYGISGEFNRLLTRDDLSAGVGPNAEK